MQLSERFKQSRKQALIQSMNKDKSSVVIVMTKEPEVQPVIEKQEIVIHVETNSEPKSEIDSLSMIEKMEKLKEISEKLEMECCETEQETIETFTNTIDTFMSSLKSFEVLVKLLHWKTTSFAKHIALDELVESIQDLIDQLIEKSQTERQLDLVVFETKIEISELEHVKEMLEYVRTNRTIFPYSFQQNIIDEIESVLSTGIYKLNFLH